MVTLSINDKNILSKYKTDDIIWKMSCFFKDEFWIEDELILCSMDLDSAHKDIKSAYFEAKKLPESDFIDY